MVSEPPEARPEEVVDGAAASPAGGAALSRGTLKARLSPESINNKCFSVPSKKPGHRWSMGNYPPTKKPELEPPVKILERFQGRWSMGILPFVKKSYPTDPSPQRPGSAYHLPPYQPKPHEASARKPNVIWQEFDLPVKSQSCSMFPRQEAESHLAEVDLPLNVRNRRGAQRSETMGDLAATVRNPPKLMPKPRSQGLEQASG